jgi:hypothetical protein
VLLHFAMLAVKVGVFHAELRAQIADGDARERLRRQLPSNIFVQYLAGPHEVRTGIMGLMLRAIAIITLVIFPIALLVFFQLVLAISRRVDHLVAALRRPPRHSFVVGALAIDRSGQDNLDFVARLLEG